MSTKGADVGEKSEVSDPCSVEYLWLSHVNLLYTEKLLWVKQYQVVKKKRKKINLLYLKRCCLRYSTLTRLETSTINKNTTSICLYLCIYTSIIYLCAQSNLLKLLYPDVHTLIKKIET